MKTYITAILILLTLAGCERIESNIKGYNPDTDALINKAVDGKILTRGESNIGKNKHYWLVYDYCKIDLYSEGHIPYEQKGTDNWYCTGKDGSQIMIQSPLDLSVHKISDSTLARIKTIMLNP